MDRIRKIISENGETLIYAIDATEIVQDSMTRIQSFPPATVHLGQAMMAVLLLQAMGAEKEGTETVALDWLCEGPFGHLYAEARNHGEVRATIQNPQAPIFDYDTKLGLGQLRVRKTRIVSTTSIINAEGNVASDILLYLEQSEQRHTGINFSVHIEWNDPNDPAKGFRVERAIGYLIDLLPQDSKQKFEDALLRWDRRMREIPQMSKWALDPKDRVSGILQLISGEASPKVILDQRVLFSCHCSEERAERALALADSHDPGSKQESHTIKCEYCGKIYQL